MIKSIFVFLSFLFCIQANAQSETATTSTIKLDAVKPKQFEADKNITDAKIIADSGSLSRYSIKFNLTYMGPPVGDLDNKMQPNPDSAVGVFETSIGGAVSARYRLDSSSALNVGTGVSALTPVQGVSRYDVKNPFLSYDRTARVADVQMRNSFGVSAVTNPVYRNLGEYAGLSYDNSLVNNLGASGWAVGVDTSFSYYLFEREYKKSDGRGVSRFNLAFFPQIKYNFSDKANVYTSLAFNYLNPNSETDLSILLNKTLSQRLGMGYAFTRDIYFAPYLNFYPSRLSPDMVTINLSTTFSLL